MRLPLVIMAAGLSTRFGRLKQLHPIGPHGEAILDYNVYDAARAGFDKVIFVVRPEILGAMRDHVRSVIGDALEVSFVSQELGSIPPDFRAPPDRRKPWGTGQAVLEATRDLHQPFAVCNADDLYGAGAFRLIAEHLRASPARTESALIGYTLSDTLTGAGSVARGVCVLRREGYLERITEVRDIHRKDGWVRGVEVDGEPVELTGGETVSMNLWGFQPSVIPLLHRQFVRFLGLWGSDTQQEFFLSTAISDQIRLGATSVQVLHAPELWFGMTHATDHDRTKVEILSRIENGAYPDDLAAAFAVKA
ncbi:MAG: NTP transferase domain-containing protein [Microthrixaceae bacterium]|nr:NTP transferase domain-containing protein [Microthrixaceae bacterium]